MITYTNKAVFINSALGNFTNFLKFLNQSTTNWRKVIVLEESQQNLKSKTGFSSAFLCVHTDFNSIAHWNFLLVSWFSKLLLSVLGVCPLICRFDYLVLIVFTEKRSMESICWPRWSWEARMYASSLPLSQRKGTIIVMTSSGATWKVKPAGFEPVSNARVREVCEGVFGPRGSSSYPSCQILHGPLARPLRSPTLIASTCHEDG